MSQTSDRDHRPVPGDVPNEEDAEERFGVLHDGRPLAEQGLVESTRTAASTTMIGTANER